MTTNVLPPELDRHFILDIVNMDTEEEEPPLVTPAQHHLAAVNNNQPTTTQQHLYQSQEHVINTQQYTKQQQQRREREYHMFATCVVQLKSRYTGAYRQNLGSGESKSMRKSQAIFDARRKAVENGMRRCLDAFGGNVIAYVRETTALMQKQQNAA